MATGEVVSFSCNILIPDNCKTHLKLALLFTHIIVTTYHLLSLFFLPPLPKHTTDALLAITVNGVAKLWLLPSRSEIKDQEHVYEEKSKCLDVSSAPVSLTSYVYGNHCIVLVVWPQVWQVSVSVC